MPATPSSSGRKRASSRPDRVRSTISQAEQPTGIPVSPVTGLDPLQAPLGYGELVSGWQLLAKSARLFRFRDGPEKLLQESVVLAVELLGGPSILYLTVADVPTSLAIRAFHPTEPWLAAIASDLLGEHSHIGEGVVGQLLAEGGPLLVSDVRGLGLPPGSVDLPESFSSAGVFSLMLIPIKTESRCIGALINMSQQGKRQGENDLALGVALSELIAAALDGQNTLFDLQRAVKIRDMSMSVASHELRNALATTRALVQMSMRTIKTGDQGSLTRVENHLETMLRQIDWLTDLTRDVFDVSKVDDELMELRRGPTSLNSVVVGVVERFRGVVAEHTKHRLSVELPKTQLVGCWDRDRIDQVLTNLLANAIKYSPGGGLLTVRVEQKKMCSIESAADVVKGTTFDGRQMAVVAVSDQGIGIPSNQLASIFEPYYRATNVPKELSGGLGLGLHICKCIVEAHGGKLWVESEDGRGSTFYFSLPLESA